MEVLIQLLFGICWLVSLVGWILLAIAGFRVSVLWGIGNLLLPVPVGVIFAIKYWDSARMGCLLQLIPFVLMVGIGIVAGITGATMGIMEQVEYIEDVNEQIDAEQARLEAARSSGSGGGGTAVQPIPAPAPIPSVGSTTTTTQARTTAPAAAPRAAPRFAFREFRPEELPSAVGKSVRIELKDGRQRTGKLVSVEDGTLRVEQRSSGGSMEYPVQLDQAKRILVREVVQ